MKRGNLSTAEKYELEIRKPKEYCDKKDYEIGDLNVKISPLNKEILRNRETQRRKDIMNPKIDRSCRNTQSHKQLRRFYLHSEKVKR